MSGYRQHDRFVWSARDGLRWLKWRAGGATAVFPTRSGGVSPAPWDSLNLGLSVGDDTVRVSQNRRRLCAALDLPAERMVIPHQVHETNVRWVGSGEAGRGVDDVRTALPDCDGLVTAEPNVVLAVSTADCLPVVIVAAGADGPLLAAVHAGWRGVDAGIAGKAAVMLARRGRLVAAAIGPSIGPCCFVVDEELRARFARRFPASVAAPSWAAPSAAGTDVRGVNLWAAVVADLVEAGVPDDAIDVAGVCVSCDARFFSHRRDAGLTGRHLTLAWIPTADAQSRGGAVAAGE